VLGPRSFVTYAEDVPEIFQQHRVCQYMFANNMQGTKQSKPPKIQEVTAGLGACATAANDWCASKRLQLNTKQTEVMWFDSATNLSKLSPTDKLIQVVPDTISPYVVVRDLRVIFDCELNMKSPISRIIRACFYHLRCLHAERRQLDQLV
jgi:hypothetical protein